MKIHNRQLLTEIQAEFPEAAAQIKSWHAITKNADWKTSHDVRHQFPKAKIMGSKNVVFKILRNRYRLWVRIDYQHAIVFIKKFGMHKEYDKWDIK